MNHQKPKDASGISAKAEDAPSDRPSSKSQRTRLRILDSAIEHFGTSGYQGGSVAGVARMAGVSPGAVFSYYPSKDDLYLAAADREISAAVGVAYESSRQAARPWVAFLRQLVGAMDRHPLLGRILAEGPPHLIDQLLDLEPIGRIGGAVRRDLEQAQADGRARLDGDPELLSTGVETIALALLTARRVNGIGTQPERIAGVAAVLMAVAAPPEPKHTRKKSSNGG